MPEQDLYDRSETRDAVGLVVKAVEDCERRYHDAFVDRVERRYNAYRGLAEPAANDDRVMAFGLALEMYRQYGTHERRVQRKAKKRPPHKYKWQRRAA